MVSLDRLVKPTCLALGLLSGSAAFSQSLTGILVSPSTVTGGASATGTVAISAKAPTGGFSVALASLRPSLVSVPASIKIPSGATTAQFAVKTAPNKESFTAIITAKAANVSKSFTLAVKDDSIAALTLSPSTLAGGSFGTGTLSLYTPAPAGGWTVSLTSANSAYVQVPKTVSFAAGATSATFKIVTEKYKATIADLITASDSASQKTATLTVTDDTVAALSFAPAYVLGGKTSTGTVTMAGPVPAGGWTVKLASQYPSKVGIPASVFIPAAATSATFPITTKLGATTYANTIQASDSRSGVKSNLIVETPGFISIKLQPNDLAYDPVHDHLLVAPASENGSLDVIDPSTGDIIATPLLPAAANLVTMSGDNTNVIVALTDNTVRVLDPVTFVVKETISSGAICLTAIPKTSDSFVVCSDPWSTIYDGTKPRPNTVDIGIVQAASADGIHYTGVDYRYSPSAYGVNMITKNGFTPPVTGFGPGSPALTFQYGYPVDGGGNVLDPNTAVKLFQLPAISAPNHRICALADGVTVLNLTWPPEMAQALNVRTRTQTGLVTLPNIDGGLGKVIPLGAHRFAYSNFGAISDFQLIIATCPQIP